MGPVQVSYLTSVQAIAEYTHMNAKPSLEYKFGQRHACDKLEPQDQLFPGPPFISLRHRFPGG